MLSLRALGLGTGMGEHESFSGLYMNRQEAMREVDL